MGVNDMCTDEKGNLWIATGNGLNIFNGKTVEKYFASEHPELQNSNVIHVTRDSSKRVWVLTANGNVTMFDEKRQLHRVGLYEKNEFVKTRWILNSQRGGIILFTHKGHFELKAGTLTTVKDSIPSSCFLSVTIQGFDSLQPKFYRQVFYLDDDHYLFMRDEAFHKVNYKTKKVERSYSITDCNALMKWNENELLASNLKTKEVQLINLITGEVAYPFRDLKDQFGRKITADFRFAEKINSTQWLFTTTNDGIYIYDRRTNKIYNYRHNIADPSTISDNFTRTIAVGKKGWVFISCQPAISYFNSNDFIGSQNVFIDDKGKGYDGYIAGIATKDNNTYYVGTGEGLLEWKRNTNTTTFLQYSDKNGNPLPEKEEVSSIVIDRNDRIWATTISHGIIVLGKNRSLLKQISNTTPGKGSVKLKGVYYLLVGPDGGIWASGRNGISKIDPQNFEVDNFENSPLARFDTVTCGTMLFTDKDNLWIATNIGVFHYNLVTGAIDEYTARDGLAANGIYTINADNEKNIYIGSALGLNILYPNGRIKTITHKNGLLIDRAEGLLLDRHNRMWIGNDIGLACYDPKDSSLVTFDERYGLSIYGFRVNSYFQTPNGEFAFGTPHGIQYFHPDSLYNKKIALNALINKVETKNLVSSITENSVLNLSATNNQVSFYFSSVDFSPHVRTYYKYKLEGIDKDWVTVADVNSVRYNSLPPGTFNFKLLLSNDNKTWQRADNEVTIIIATPFYRTWWFKMISTLVALVIIWFVWRHFRRAHIKQKEELETQIVIGYFASRINSYQKIEDVLWDVARNCISKLHFEDCVIYLLDEERNVLVQKAAYGPKLARDFTIHQPIEIPVGKGIVGTVAETGNPALIPNTELDERYIVDDMRRYSEVAVPLIIDDKVIGVIDSEHSKKNFFTQRHLNTLSTIAVLCANQVHRARAEEEKQKAKIEVLENKQKVAESRLQSLRLQMNPHFLFNALNSVQQMILANEELVATRFLSRFSKLLRAILVNSDKETVTLKEELEILNLYIELEARRFKDSFQYTIRCDDDIDEDEIKIPTLLIQPFVENAIWHGLMHKDGNRNLNIRFSETDNFLKCVIEDNGVGRKRSEEAKKANGQDRGHISKGIKVSLERLKTIHNQEGNEGSLNITDLYDEKGHAAGTRVEINFPIQN